jgi:RND family efflux transporter MFP subunit
VSWRSPKFLLPIAVLGSALIAAVVMVLARPRVEARAPEVVAPRVRVVEAAPRDVRLSVKTQGTVVPRTESSLVPEVGGRVVWVSPALAAGGFFGAGEPLVKLDPTDYELRVKRAEAALASARSHATLASRNRDRQQQLAREELIATTSREDAEHAAAASAATLREAETALEQAERDLERATLTAPYDGRVREEQVDVGQFVERGTPLAKLYAVDYAEVRLPVPDADLAFLDLRLDHRGETPRDQGLPVVLSARFAGAEHTWDARIVRTEGEIDPKSRMVHAVARVDDPYRRSAGDDRPPLAVGMFVEAEIVGREVPGAFVLPRAALRGADGALVVDGEDRLRERKLTVLRSSGEEVVVTGGLEPGDRVCVSPLEAAVDGMRVQAVADPGSAQPSVAEEPRAEPPAPGRS